MIELFWISLGLLLYHLVFYGIILKLLNVFFAVKHELGKKFKPKVTMLTSAYNEEAVIENKLKSFTELDYPTDKIDLIIISDDSEDRTNEIVTDYAEKFSNIKLIIQKPRAGKASALNQVESSLECDIVVSSDASSILEKKSITNLVKHFGDEKIGLVSGKLMYYAKGDSKSSEGIYWRYETWLKLLESSLGSIIGASGCLFAVRRELYGQIHPASPDDFERTLIALEKGYKTMIEPQAIVYEKLEKNSGDEINRKIRMISTEWFAVLRHLKLINPFRYLQYSFMLISHKIIRWLLPFISICMLVSSLLLYNYWIYRFFFGAQIFIYLVGTVALFLEKKYTINVFFRLCGYWVAMNYSSFFAFIKFISGSQQKTWETG